MTPSRTSGCYFWVPNAHYGTWMQLPMVECRAQTYIKGSASRTRLKQYFTNVTDADIKNCQYAFPLYDGVSVVGFKGRIGGEVLQGLVKEREDAKQEFNDAVAQGESAGLMEQDLSASDCFTTSLGNIPKSSTAVVTIEYIGELKHDMENDSLKFEMPTGIAPRYGGHASGNSAQWPIPHSPLPEAKQFEWTCDLEMPTAITKVESPSHAVSVSLGQLSMDETEDLDFKKCSAKMSLQKESGLSKELILTVKCKGIKDPVALWEKYKKVQGQTALMTTLVPNFALPQIKPEIIFVCDRSSSMAGNPIQTLVEALKVMLHSLPTNGIKFNILSFGSRYSFLFPKSQAYSKESLQKAKTHLHSMTADYGGTETENAVRAAIDNRYGDIPLEIIVLTDGDIWNQGSLFSYLNEKVEESKQQIRVFPLGIGHGVSTALIEGVARAGNGFASTVMPGERMDQRCVRMLKGALSPHITDYKLEVQYEKEEEDGFEIVESVEAAANLSLRPKAFDLEKRGKEISKKSISLFDSSVDADDTEMAGPDANIPESMKAPTILQAPFSMPPLYAFSRTTVYLLLSPEASQRTPKSVILKGTLDNAELKLEIPVTNIGFGRTIHQLAARRAVQDLEEGRGWPFQAKDSDGKSAKEAHPSSFDEIVKNEAVRLGTGFQVMNKWCSYVARDKFASDKKGAESYASKPSQTAKREVDIDYSESDDDMGFGLLNEGYSMPDPSPPGAAVSHTRGIFGDSDPFAPPKPFAPLPSGLPSSSRSPFRKGTPFGNNSPASAGASLFGNISTTQQASRGAFSVPPGAGYPTSRTSLFGNTSNSATKLLPNVSSGGPFGAPVRRDRDRAISHNPFRGGQFSQTGGPFGGNFGGATSQHGGFGATGSQQNTPSLFGSASTGGDTTASLFNKPAASLFAPASTGSSLFGAPSASRPLTAAGGASNDGHSNGAQVNNDGFGVPSFRPATPSLFGSDPQAPSGHASDAAVLFPPTVVIQPDVLAQYIMKMEDAACMPLPSEDGPDLIDDKVSEENDLETSHQHGSRSRRSAPSLTRGGRGGFDGGRGGGRGGQIQAPSKLMAARKAAPSYYNVYAAAASADQDEEDDLKIEFDGMEGVDTELELRTGALPLMAAKPTAMEDVKHGCKRKSKRTSTSSSPLIPTFDSDAKRVHFVLGLQEFDGSFEIKRAWDLASAMSLKEQHIVDPTKPGLSSVVWATVLVLTWLEKYMGSEKEIWELAADKARNWLAEQGADLVALTTNAIAVLKR